MDKTQPPIIEDMRIAHMRRERQKIAAWLQTRRGKPQYRPAPPAGRAVARVVKPLSKKFSGSSSAARLTPHWPSIIGERWAKFSRPEKFSASKNGKILIISAPGPAAALIMASAGPIIERVNIYMGEGVVTGIKVLQTKMKHSVGGGTAEDRSRGSKTSAASHKSSANIQRGLTPSQEDRLQSGLDHIKQDPLKAALAALGRNVLKQRDP